jgi:hypothetical protein
MARIDDGFATLITLTAGAVSIWEKTVTPPSADGGGPNDTTTMRNIRYRTKAPKKLLTLGSATFTAAYDPIFYTQVVGQMQVNQLIIITFPDGHTLSFWGWLDKIAPNEIKEGDQPTAACTIECSNQNNAGVEVAPAYA